MKTTFFRTILDLAEQKEAINLVVGDVGFGAIEPFAERFPKRFLNVGIAEQNMIGIAAGMALSGKIVFVYSIANFPTLRCFEQIRNDICYHKLNVKIVTVGGGLAYGPLGASHHATEDIAIMRTLPEMLVVAPGDTLETEMATRLITNYPGPCYLRLGRAGEPQIHQTGLAFNLGKAIKVRNGDHLTLISTGGLLETSLKAAELMALDGIQVRVLSMHTIKPLDIEAVQAAASETNAIVTVEEHSIIGGLGSAVAEVLAEYSGKSISFKRLGLPSSFSTQVGDQQYLRAIYGLTPEGIVKSLRSVLDLVIK